MKPQELSDSILSKMRPSDRRALGVQTSEEAMAAFSARTEMELQTQISQYLRLKGLWFYCARMDKKTTASVGTPDYLLVCHGVPVALEAKQPKGKLTKEQVETHEHMRKNGWRVAVVRSVQDVKQVLDNLIP